jgi:hypothetical protein
LRRAPRARWSTRAPAHRSGVSPGDHRLDRPGALAGLAAARSAAPTVIAGRRLGRARPARRRRLGNCRVGSPGGVGACHLGGPRVRAAPRVRPGEGADADRRPARQHRRVHVLASAGGLRLPDRHGAVLRAARARAGVPGRTAAGSCTARNLGRSAQGGTRRPARDLRRTGSRRSVGPDRAARPPPRSARCLLVRLSGRVHRLGPVARALRRRVRRGQLPGDRRDGAGYLGLGLARSRARHRRAGQPAFGRGGRLRLVRPVRPTAGAVRAASAARPAAGSWGSAGTQPAENLVVEQAVGGHRVAAERTLDPVQ